MNDRKILKFPHYGKTYWFHQCEEKSSRDCSRFPTSYTSLVFWSWPISRALDYHLGVHLWVSSEKVRKLEVTTLSQPNKPHEKNLRTHEERSSFRPNSSIIEVENPEDLVWKFHDFLITQILREIKFGYSRSAKTAILPHSEALNSEFWFL